MKKFTSRIGNRILLGFSGVIILSFCISLMFFSAQRISVFSNEELMEMAPPLSQSQYSSLENLNSITHEAMEFYSYMIFLSICLAIVIMFLYVKPRIIERINLISESIERLAGGDLDKEIKIKGNDEIAEMMAALEGLRLNLVQKKKYEQEMENIRLRLEENEKRYLLTTRAARIGLWDWNPTTNETFFNDEWYTMLGYFPGEIPGTFETFQSLCHPDDFKKCTKALSDHFDTGRDYKINFRMKHKRGHWVWIMTTGKVTNWDSEGRPQRMSGIHMDISERKRVVDELHRMKNNLEKEIETRTLEYKEQKLIAERANRSKDEFLANMSHELRTPLNSILGLTDMVMNNDALPADLRKDLGIVKNASNTLLGIVNDVLDIAKIEAGSIDLEEEPFNLAEALLIVASQLSPLAEQKGLSFKNNFADYSNATVIGDPFRFRQIMINLVGNAIKYTEAGEVEIEIELHKHDVSHETEVFTCKVKDTGIGISPEKLPTIFDKFTQAETTSKRKYQGTGLGLNIAKRLVDQMGGEIRVFSTLGKGSVFTLTIPFKHADAKMLNQAQNNEPGIEIKQGEKKSFEKAKVLVAEDHELNRLYMTKLLEKLKCGKFHFALNGRQAVEMYKKEPWDVVLMDCHMPDINGFEATAKIRDLEKEKSDRTPIVAITADAMQGTKQTCIDAGMDMYISKPIDEKKFVLMLENWFELSGRTISSIQHENIDSKILDLSLLKEYSNDDFDFEQQLVQSFYSSGQQDLKLLQSNTQKSNHGHFVEAAHKLKGSSAFIGANSLSALCQTAQIIPKEKKSAERKKIVQDISDEFSKVIDCLKAMDYLG